MLIYLASTETKKKIFIVNTFQHLSPWQGDDLMRSITPLLVCNLLLDFE